MGKPQQNRLLRAAQLLQHSLDGLVVVTPNHIAHEGAIGTGPCWIREWLERDERQAVP